MGVLLESLKNYFKNTPKEELDKDWKEIEYLNEIGPDVFEYAEFVKANFDTETTVGAQYQAGGCIIEAEVE